MKKTLFQMIMIAMNLAVVAILVTIFLHYYQVDIYKKTTSKFYQQLSDVKVKQVTNDPGVTIVKSNIDNFDYRKPHPYCGFKTQASTETVSHDGKLSISTNRLGQRSPDLPEGKTAQRIAIVGGSVAFQGSANDKSIIAQLAKLFTDHGAKTDYINTGVLSFISDQELSVLVHDLLKEKVDTVIAFDGFNDVHSIMYFNGRVGWPPIRWDSFGDKFTTHMGQLAPAYYPPIEPMLDRTPPERIEAALDNYLENIQIMARICQGLGVRFIACLQPVRGFDPAKCTPNAKISNELGKKDYFFCRVRGTFEKWNAERLYGASYLSFIDFFKEEQGVFIDECHFSDDGNRQVAERLYSVLAQDGPPPAAGN